MKTLEHADIMPSIRKNAHFQKAIVNAAKHFFDDDRTEYDATMKILALLCSYRTPEMTSAAEEIKAGSILARELVLLTVTAHTSSAWHVSNLGKVA